MYIYLAISNNYYIGKTNKFQYTIKKKSMFYGSINKHCLSLKIEE